MNSLHPMNDQRPVDMVFLRTINSVQLSDAVVDELLCKSQNPQKYHV